MLYQEELVVTALELTVRQLIAVQIPTVHVYLLEDFHNQLPRLK